MDTNTAVDGWLAQVGDASGLRLGLGEDGACAVEFGDGLECVVEPEPPTGLVHLHAELVRLPLADAARRAVLEEALALNLFARATEGAVIGLDRAGDALVASVSRPVDGLDDQGFAALLEGFIGIARTLRERLGGGGAPAAAAPADGRDEASPGLSRAGLVIRA